MKKLLGILILFLLFQSSALACNDWLVKEKNFPKEKEQWILYKNGTILQSSCKVNKNNDKVLEKIITNIEFKNHYIVWAKRQIERYEILHKQYPKAGYNYTARNWKNNLKWSKKNQTFANGELIKVNAINGIGFTLPMPNNNKYKKKRLLLTITLKVTDYYFSSQRYSYNPNVNGGLIIENNPISYKIGEIIDKQIKKITLEKNKNQLSFTYAPSPKHLMLGTSNIHTELIITISETKSDKSYSISYPNPLLLQAVAIGEFTHNTTGGLKCLE